LIALSGLQSSVARAIVRVTQRVLLSGVPWNRRLVELFPSPTICETRGVAMKWILVVLIGGVTPIQTDLQFEKLSDCLSAEEQLRTTNAEAYAAWEKSDTTNFERRRDYRKAREFQERRLANTGTCIPHSGTGQPVTVTRSGEQPSASPPQPPAN
jgi:hypothetical protein